MKRIFLLLIVVLASFAALTGCKGDKIYIDGYSVIIGED